MGLLAGHDRQHEALDVGEPPPLKVDPPVMGVAGEGDALRGLVLGHDVGTGPNELAWGRVHPPGLVELPRLVRRIELVPGEDPHPDRPQKRPKRLRGPEANRQAVDLGDLDGLAGHGEDVLEAVGDLAVVDHLKRERDIVRRHRGAVAPLEPLTQFERPGPPVRARPPGLGEGGFGLRRLPVVLDQAVEQPADRPGRRCLLRQNRIEGARIGDLGIEKRAPEASRLAEHHLGMRQPWKARPRRARFRWRRAGRAYGVSQDVRGEEQSGGDRDDRETLHSVRSSEAPCTTVSGAYPSASRLVPAPSNRTVTIARGPSPSTSSTRPIPKVLCRT